LSAEEAAARFYRRPFAAHPALLDGTFNCGNQVSGAQQQALARSVAAFASALVNTPDRLPENLLSRIAHKHASLGIRPDQYRVVHDNLMRAIVDVLGDAVTPDVAAAWDEVHWLMVNALINHERGLYSARGVRPEAYYCASHASAATTIAWVPVSRVGWMTGANAAEWLTGMSWATRPALSAAAYMAGSVPPMPQ
jgi:hemoglobin-like flavoprotein